LRGPRCACLTKAIDLDPTQIAAYHDLVHCKKLDAADRPLVARMLARLEAGDLADHERALLHFALGKGLDDLGAWEEAIGHIDQANRLERRGLLFDREALADRCDRLMAVFTPDRIARSRGVADCEKPILIVGMPRSGTTLVEQVLSSCAAGFVRSKYDRITTCVSSSGRPALLPQQRPGVTIRVPDWAGSATG